MGIFGQAGRDVRLEWGPEGVSELGQECAVLIVIDVLSFTTTVDLVVSQGGRVRPLRWRGETVVRPSSVLRLPPGTVLDLPSPNGATLCAAAAGAGAHVMAGCLRNATSVAAAAHRLAGDGPIGVIPAGERWGVNIFGHGTGGGLRPCVEDHLGAGAIVNALLPSGRSASPEALLAATAYRTMDLAAALTGCVSGRELIETGHAHDVDLAARLDASTTAPLLTGTTLRDESASSAVQQGAFTTDEP